MFVHSVLQSPKMLKNFVSGVLVAYEKTYIHDVEN